MTLSDIAIASGTHIKEAMYQGDQSKLNTRYNGIPVEQKKPDESSWKEWRWFCNLLCSHRETRELENKLGDWIVKPQEMRRQWLLWYDSMEDVIYQHQQEGGYTVHQ